MVQVKVGDKEVDVNTAFRLYITTKLPNPSYTPEVAARTSIIDFAVNLKGNPGDDVRGVGALGGAPHRLCFPAQASRTSCWAASS